MKNTKFNIGSYYTATGTCGMTDGLEVKGILTKIDEWGAYLTCAHGISHLCNKQTLIPVKNSIDKAIESLKNYRKENKSFT